ncbi:MAG: hypothetical protein E3J72_07715 [Planctomycetota bacterium]|nr:MAG: hypothetical protein E3J72_07715 [Planctomycetota bacterium]
MPDGWFHAGDPDLVKLGDQWFMFFTSITFDNARMELHTLAATLPPGDGLGSDVSNWTIMDDGNGSVLSVISPGPNPGDWDHDAIETPNYIRGYDNTAGQWVERIYYTGWRNLPGNDSVLYTDDDLYDYRIGCVEWDGNAWAKHPSNPVLTGANAWELFYGLGFLGDQALHYEPGPGPGGEGGVWHMWYQAVNSETPSLAVVSIHATSSDGITWLAGDREKMPQSGPYATAFLPNGPYYCDMEELDGGYHFCGWVPANDDPELQGLYVVESSTLDGSAPGDFTNWHLLVKEMNGTYWHDSAEDPTGEEGLFGSTLKRDGGELWLFYHGAAYRDGGYIASIGRKLILDYP